jgi:hypothetical protein
MQALKCGDYTRARQHKYRRNKRHSSELVNFTMVAVYIHIMLQVLFASLSCLLAWILYCVAIVARRRAIVKRQFPGPPTSSFLLGDIPPLLTATSGAQSNRPFAAARDLPHSLLFFRTSRTHSCARVGNLAETNVPDRHKVIPYSSAIAHARNHCSVCGVVPRRH